MNKRYVKELAKDIEKEINRRIRIVQKPNTLTIYNLSKLEKQSNRLKYIMTAYENGYVRDFDAVRELVAIFDI